MINGEFQWDELALTRFPSGFVSEAHNIIQARSELIEEGYEFPDLNLSFVQPLSIFSLGTTIPSTTNTIYVANYIAIHEESTNGVDWVLKKIEQVKFERQPTSMIRVRLQLTIPTNNTRN